MSDSNPIDSADRGLELRRKILHKQPLKRFYEDIYAEYLATIQRSSPSGLVVEIGAGGSFFKSKYSSVTTTDVLPYDGVDQVVDATAMPFTDSSVSTFLLMNVLHHIPDAEAFFSEVDRCLVPGGRIYFLDQHVSPMSRLLFKYAHHEPFTPDAIDWKFETTGPLSGANGALAWIVFSRDRDRFTEKFPKLKIVRYEPRTPILYWLIGGLKNWSLVPGGAYRLAYWLDRATSKLFPWMNSFVSIELEHL